MIYFLGTVQGRHLLIHLLPTPNLHFSVRETILEILESLCLLYFFRFSLKTRYIVENVLIKGEL